MKKALVLMAIFASSSVSAMVCETIYVQDFSNRTQQVLEAEGIPYMHYADRESAELILSKAVTTNDIVIGGREYKSFKCTSSWLFGGTCRTGIETHKLSFDISKKFSNATGSGVARLSASTNEMFSGKLYHVNSDSSLDRSEYENKITESYMRIVNEIKRICSNY